MSRSSLRLGLLQTDIHWRAPERNFESLAPQLEHLAADKVQLAVLPEMFAHGFCMDAEEVAEDEDGPSSSFLREQAQKLGMHICGSAPLRSAAALRPVNRFILARPDGSCSFYDKIHPFSLAGEDKVYSPGTRVCSFDVEGFRVTPFICYDLRFANVFWEAGPSTDLFLVIANWPEKRRQAFSQLLRARAIENQAFVAGVNRVGEGDGLAYDGGSCLIDPSGACMVEAIGKATVLRAELQLDELRQLRQKLAFLPDRRVQQTDGTWRAAPEVGP